MKKIQKIFIALSTMILLLSNIFSTIIYANELHKNIEQNKENILANENISRLSSEVTTIYRELIRYDQSTNKFYVNETETEQYYNYDNESVKGVYLMKDSLNDEVTNGSTNISELVNKKIYEIEYVLKGNDINILISKNNRFKRADFSWIQRCIQEAWGSTISLVTLKGIVNLFKAGKFEAAAAKLASSTAGRIAGVAALFAFLATCGATTVS
ncbi:hypothetical protein [Streptococcus uberis]|uniref:Exported protein n=2 Tax=Streptococcus uberis TaxID=1349 RepID=B9DVV0_STRU0|nr:hypothetical protein [Streptococcus uberis]KKF40572.1 hypothetical protein AF63_08230 [Streptococcus uberis Ab71]KKF41002.1 hypothetical protein AF64_08215 [Streptococcus uberis C9359]KKF46282.1 hypothetical protein AF59_01415 [Streptococcus uberis C5072]KKF47036.1 hypothetical protein AF60_01875 [Streptococcus uberis S6261]KKF51857.1 hypothetical protein AF65_08275 [Streptococcus uberis C5388]